MPITKFEDIPNELLLYIFEFLDGFHLIFAFDKLNFRFTSLTNDVHLHFNLTNLKKTEFDYVFDYIFPFKNNVFSLILSNRNTLGPLEMFIARFQNLIPHNPLHYLKLIDIHTEALLSFLTVVLPKLIHLVSLSLVDVTFYPYRRRPIKYISEQLPLLTHVSLSFRQQLSYPSWILTQLYSTFSTIEYLSLYGFSYDITRLPDLFQHLYKIEHLEIKLDIDDDIGCWGPWILDSVLIRNGGQHLRSLIIQIEFRLLFVEIASFLKYFPQLKNLSLVTHEFTHDIQFYDGEKWEELIQTALPCLISFRLYLKSKRFTSDISLTVIIDKFRSSFWINEKKWYIVCDKFTNEFIQLYTIPCPKNVTVTLNIISSNWDTTLPSFNLSTFDSITCLIVNTTELQHNQTPLPYFNNIKSLHILSLPTKNYCLSQHINLLQIESAIDSRWIPSHR
ncbi:unnamed protein product [Rotaria sordida]|uniref:F-box domain-containing protein n=1 Tax=Rotaria sordida TaxID=392033 RepID=A0A814XFR7_9BILA|nr:unnamed protein product [Rotaria sordida]CAF1217257.1 unnamed protein product [Rotaria sordida]CAF3723342.1 unnamed protein product [Rotaria sordida]CAF3782528.1 unnamed protein product [Rotaria sordida]CAF3905125.1 unnamed protein product [Rotaria sordida]